MENKWAVVLATAVGLGISGGSYAVGRTQSDTPESIIARAEAAKQYIATTDSAKIAIGDGIFDTEEKYARFEQYIRSIVRLKTENRITVEDEKMQKTLEWMGYIHEVLEFTNAFERAANAVKDDDKQSMLNVPNFNGLMEGNSSVVSIWRTGLSEAAASGIRLNFLKERFERAVRIAKALEDKIDKQRRKSNLRNSDIESLNRQWEAVISTQAFFATATETLNRR